MAALAEYAGLIAEAGPEAVRMVATSATRDAVNSAEFTDRVRAILGVAPEVISGDDEAWLSFTGATRELAGPPLAAAGSCPPPYLVTDIGGGSTEFIFGAPGDAGEPDGMPRGQLSGRSVNIGCVRMTERHLHGDPPLPAEIAATIKDIDAALELAAEAVPAEKARTLVGLAGSVTTVAGIALGLGEYDSAPHPSFAVICAARVHEIAGELLAMTRAERAAIPVMHPGRVDVIGAGALILDRIMTRFGFAEVLVSEHDILDGIAWSLVRLPRPDVRRLDSGWTLYLVFVGEAVRGGPVAPGTGWPDDPADAATPVATSPADVRSFAAGSVGLAELTARQSVCRACPRLVAWREDVAAIRRKSFRDEQYWGRPIPGWGDPEPAILILGLAPAAHGGNRTGRIFTGDRSGDFLFASLYRCGLATKPTSVAAGDGQRLIGVRMAAAVRCAPPENKPLPEERDTCAPWLAAEFRMIAADPAGGGLPRRLCLAGAVAGPRGVRLPGAAATPGLRARRPGAGSGSRRRATAAARLLPPEPAEHVHRPGHARHDRRDLPPGARGSRPRRRLRWLRVARRHSLLTRTQSTSISAVVVAAGIVPPIRLSSSRAAV